MGATDLTAVVDTTSGGPVTPCYLVIDPGVAAKREYVYFDGVFTGTNLVTSDIANRFLAGSAAASGLTHAVGAKVRCATTSELITDIFDYIDSVKTALTAAGDLPYATAASTWARLAKGTARQALIMNAGATAPSWGDSLASLLTAQADTPYASAANTPARLPKGTGLQYYRMNAGATAPEWATLITQAVFYETHTWAISGAIAVPSGETNYINAMFIEPGTAETITVVKVDAVIHAGTSATFKMQKNGADMSGLTGISATTSAAGTTPTPLSVTTGDQVAPVVTAVTGSPTNLTVSVVLKHVVTLA
jgi:hypothetical protein